MGKILEEKQPCTYCQTPVIRVKRRPENINKKGRWYWLSYLYCIKCKRRFFVESEKILVRAKRVYVKRETKASRRIERY